MEETEDYRESHLHKGEHYHAAFSDKPYRRMVWGYEKSLLDIIAQEMNGGAGYDHLDFACGTGRILSHLKERARMSVGIDLSPSMLAVARKHNPQIEIIEADITRNDVLGDRQFDLITAFRFFPNAQPQLRQEVVEVLKKHIKPNGLLVFNNHRNKSSTRYRLLHLLGRRPHGMYMEEVESLMARNGLRVVNTYGLSIFPASDHRHLLPMKWVERIEALLVRFGALRNFGENQVIVCKYAKDVANNDSDS